MCSFCVDVVYMLCICCVVLLCNDVFHWLCRCLNVDYMLCRYSADVVYYCCVYVVQYQLCICCVVLDVWYLCVVVYLVGAHGHGDVLLGDLVVSDVPDVVPGQFEDVSRDVLQHSHHVDGHLVVDLITKDLLAKHHGKAVRHSVFVINDEDEDEGVGAGAGEGLVQV